MYIPKNRIKPNQFTPGDELMVKQTKANYSGYYHTLYTGKIYSGKTQNEKNIIELVTIATQDGPGTPDLPPSLETTNVIALFIGDPDPIINEEQWDQGDIVTYLKVTNQNTEDDQPREVPFQMYPKPTEDDYSLGVYTRYFCVKINESIYYELDKKIYNKLKKQDSSWVWELYTCFKLQWTLTGDLNSVIVTNRNQTTIEQQRLKRLGLSGFLNEDWLKYYRYNEQESLYTSGGEYLNRRTRQEYIGDYHIHINKGPMVGQFHISSNHDYLDPIVSNTKRTTKNTPITGSSSPSSQPSPSSGYFPTTGGGY